MQVKVSMRGEDGAPVRLLIAIPEQEGESAVEHHLAKATPGAFEVVGRAHTESQALARYFQCAPDIVILDCQIMPAEPARLVGLLKRMAPGSCIVALVPAADSMASAAARALGADAIGVLAELPALLNGLTAADAV